MTEPVRFQMIVDHDPATVGRQRRPMEWFTGSVEMIIVTWYQRDKNGDGDCGGVTQSNKKIDKDLFDILYQMVTGSFRSYDYLADPELDGQPHCLQAVLG